MRKVEDVKVPSWPGGRDGGKIFRITEMPAARAEKWAWRLFVAVKGTTAEVPPEVERLGMVGVLIRGLNSMLAADVDFARIEPLLDEMFECVQIVRDPRHPDVVTPLVSDDDVEDVMTRGWLRGEIIRVHTGFSVADALSTLVTAIKAPKD